MNANEKKVIRSKRHMVASNVVWSDEFVRALKEQHLVSDGVILQIEPETNSFSRMVRYIELLVKDAAWFGAGSNGDFVRAPFQAFCDVIENEGGQPWVAEELRTELKTERGELIIEDYVRKEASQLVHRLYGGNKRLSESEKRRLESVIAVRTQCTKEVWKNNLETTQLRLADFRVAVRSNMADVVTAARVVHDAVQDQRKAIDMALNNSSGRAAISSEHMGSYRTGRDTLPTFPDIHGKSNGRAGSSHSGNEEGLGRGSAGESGARSVDELDSRSRPTYSQAWSAEDHMKGRQQQQQLVDGVGGLQGITHLLTDAADQIRRMTDYWSTERDRLRAERSRALVALGIRDSSANPSSSAAGSAPRVDVELHALLQRVNAELSTAKDRAAEAEQRAAALDDRLRTARTDVEDDLRSKDRTISLLTSSLERAEKEAEASNGEARELKRQLQMLKTELSRYSVKSRYLEKSRHLGYLRDAPDSIDVPVTNRGWTSVNSSSITRSSIDSIGKQKTQVNGQTRAIWRGTNGSSG